MMATALSRGIISLMPYRSAGELPKTGRRCPRCEEDLVAETIGENTIERCLACRGVWVAAREFNELLVDLDRQESIRDREELHYNKNADVAFLKCPKCSKTMVRSDFDRRSGILVDACRKHGIWLDRGELRSIVGYLAKRMVEMAKDRDEGVIRTKGKGPDDPFTILPDFEEGIFRHIPRRSLLGLLIDIIIQPNG